MNNIGNNMIRKVILDFDYNGSRDGFLLQNELTNWANDDLVKTIDRQLEKYNDQATIIKIDRLDIEIEVSERNDLMETISRKVAERLNHELMLMSAGDSNDNEIERLPASKAFFASFIYFLKNGRLPWWSGSISKEDFFNKLETIFESEVSVEARSELIELLHNENIKNRIVFQFPDKLFLRLINSFLPGIRQQIQKIYDDLIEIGQTIKVVERKELFNVFKKELLDKANTDSAQQTQIMFVTSFIESTIQAGVFKFLENSYEKIHDVLFRSEVANTIFLLQKRNEKEELANAKPVIPGIEVIDEKEKRIPGIYSEDVQVIRESEGIYVNNAGVVIVANFLPLLFKKLSLLENNEIINISKALSLVHYLVSGKDDYAEFELTLSKILCGIEIGTAVDTEAILDDNEKKEADEVILSVIEYWSILKDTSIPALRESFLMRKGKLWFENNEWHLQVEQRSYDMLLQQLPWSFNMIRLPWMKHLLKTNWVN